MKGFDMARERVSVTLPQELVKQVKKLARKEGENFSQSVEKYLREGLTPKGPDDGYHLAGEFKGSGHIVMPAVVWMASGEDNTMELDLDLNWLVCFYVGTKNGDLPKGGVKMDAGRGSSGAD